MDQINQIICVELLNPNIDKNNILKDIVISQMIHGPCMLHFPKAPYIIKSDQSTAARCCKNYPFAFQKTTIVQEDGYLTYRYCINGRT